MNTYKQKKKKEDIIVPLNGFMNSVLLCSDSSWWSLAKKC